MTYPATAIEVMLASPSDVKEHRVTARKVIAQWNAENSRDAKVVLLTMGWETHSGADASGDRAQALINERLVAHADLMIGIFHTRLGSPTGKEDSGTVEEIRLHHGLKKPLMLYFSDAPVSLSQVDREQYDAVVSLRKWAFGIGVIGTFKEAGEFQEMFRRDLSLMFKDNPQMRQLVRPAPVDPVVTASPLSQHAADLLKMISRSDKGQIAVQNRTDSLRYASGSAVLLEVMDTLDILKWRAALDELLSQGLIADKTGRKEMFALTPKASGLLSV